MLELEGINYWAVAAVWLVNVTVGAFWYSPARFGKKWSKLSGVNMMKLPQNEANNAILYVAISAVFQALALAIIFNSLDVTVAANGLVVGLVIWAGLVAATTIGNNFYQRLGWKFWWLTSSYFLVVITINSVILSIWQ